MGRDGHGQGSEGPLLSCERGRSLAAAEDHRTIGGPPVQTERGLWIRKMPAVTLLRAWRACSKRGLRADALAAVNSGRAVDWRKAGAATIVSAIFLFGLGHRRRLRGQRRDRCLGDRSRDQRIVGWAGCPPGKARPEGCPSPLCSQLFRVAQRVTALQYGRWAGGDIWSEQPN